MKAQSSQEQEDGLTMLHRILKDDNVDMDSALSDMEGPSDNQNLNKLEIDYRNQFEIAYRENSFENLEELSDETIGKHVTLDTLLKMDNDVIFKDENIFDDEDRSSRKRQRDSVSDTDTLFNEQTDSKKRKDSDMDNCKNAIDSIMTEQILSPISLSPTPSSDGSIQNDKTESLEIAKDLPKEPRKPVDKPARAKLKNKYEMSNIIIHKEDIPAANLRNRRSMVDNNVIKKISPHSSADHNKTVKKEPVVITNEYTVSQVAQMKRRIIDSHKLLLNFNVIKDNYARACVQLKRSVTALKDSEIHRAHLILENEELKKQLQALQQHSTGKEEANSTNIPKQNILKNEADS